MKVKLLLLIPLRNPHEFHSETPTPCITSPLLTHTAGTEALITSVRANFKFAALQVKFIVDGAKDGDFELLELDLSGAVFDYESQTSPAGAKYVSGHLQEATVAVPEADGAHSVLFGTRLFENVVRDEDNGTPIVAFTCNIRSKSDAPVSDEPEVVAKVTIGGCRVVYVQQQVPE